MGRVAAVLIALSCPLALAGLADGSREPERRAQLLLTDRQPLTLRGARFRAAEQVRLTVVAGGGRYVRRLTASRAGAFTQQFPAVTIDRCDRLLAVATGSRGSRAAIKPFQPACPPTLRSD